MNIGLDFGGYFMIKIGSIETISKYLKTANVEKILCTKPQTVFNSKDFKLNFDKFEKTITKDLENHNSDIAFHGSPFDFNKFNAEKIGNGEGLSKRGKGLYLSRSKRTAPYFANIRSKDAPLHFGSTKPLENPNPTIYTVSGLNSLNFKIVSEKEAKNISLAQEEFIKANPEFDGLEMAEGGIGEICIFPKSIDKLKITQKENVEQFVQENKGYDFRSWTRDKDKLSRLC